MSPDDQVQFSAREIEVLALVCRGMSNAEIAAELYLSINSIKTYVRTAYGKIGLDTRSRVIVWAQERGYSTGEHPWPLAHRGRATPSAPGRRRSPNPETSTSLHPVARAYLDQVFAGEPELATAVVLDAIREGMDLGEVLVDVLESAQREIGRLWAAGAVTVDQEHFCTAVTQSTMVSLYPYLFTGRDLDRRLVAVHAPGSLHQVGLRMVVDLLEHEGWATTYLGSDVAPADLPDLVAEHGASVLMISASMPSQTEVIRSMIDAVRADERTRRVPVAVGGRLFLVSPSLVDVVGADGWAADARAAVALCNRLAEVSGAR